MNGRFVRHHWLLVLGAILLLIVAASSYDSDRTDTVARAVPGADEPRDVSAFHLSSDPTGGGIGVPHEDSSTVEEVLEKGLELAEASPVHLAVRGTPDADSIRCDWRGIARAPEQRENAIRFWFGLDEEDDLPEVSFLELLFDVTFDVVGTELPETIKSNFLAIAQGGLSEEYLFLTCFADFTASEYLLGAGPTTLTVAYDRRGEAQSYELYRREHFGGHLGDDPPQTQGEYESSLLETVAQAEKSLIDRIGGYEGVVFLAPMGAHNAIAVEVWQVVAQWDLQEDDQGVVHAVRYGVPEGDPEQTQTLVNLRTRITTGSTTDAFADDRIANVSGITQYYRDIGAYGDITPDDGSTDTFTPSQPPEAYSCAGGTAVTNPGTNLGLVHDCEALFDGKDALRGTGTLNWDTGTAIDSWDGVTTAGTPTRVTKVELGSESLTGSIPAGLGTLFELAHLDLSSNSLTGDIPAELGWLHNLEELRLSGNSLTGCIPIALREVATNDLSSLNLPYCQPPAPGAPTAGTAGETSVPLTWTAVSDTSKYRVEYREGTVGPWTVDDDAITTTTHTVDGLLCGREHQFRVSAYGDGTTYETEWSGPSEALTASTGTCTPPVFGAVSYSFSVMADAAVDASVGTVSATDNSMEPVTYGITAGNEDGLFDIGENSGHITVAGDLSGQSGTTVTLTVAALNDRGGEATVTVTVSITGSCASGTAVSNPGSNPGLVGDCRTLLGLRSALAGTATLNWSADTAMSNWDGVTTGGTPRRVTQLVLNREGLSGVVPAELGDLDKLERLVLDNNELMGELPSELGNLAELQVIHLTENDLTGEIPEELGNLSNLTALWLAQNELTGEIPSELGGLTALTQLWLSENDLTGPIPAELGSLSGLEWLWLSYNDLSGTIPAELTDLANLTLLQLDGNNLEGCIPPSLRDVDINDLSGLGLSDCQQGPAAPTGVSASLMNDTFTVTWTALSGVGEYEAQWRIGGSGGTWEALPAVTTASATYTPTGGPQCSSTYEFRVRARGDGYTHATHWGPESASFTVETESCPPEFDDMSYAFDVAEDAEVDDVVGTVSATDPDTGDTVSYAITAGNTGNAFAIGSGTGEITVAAALDHETTPSYTLTVEAEDDHGKTDTVTVTVTVTDVVEDAPPAPGNLSATLLSGTFTLSWDAVTGATKYEAQHTTDASDAGTVTWTALAETTGTMQDYTPAGGVVCNTEYRFRVRAYGDGTAYLAGWGTESAAFTVETESCPPEFDDMSYAFDVAEDAEVDDVVGTVSATDPDTGDTVSYAITAGNTGNAFAIGSGTGEITVAAALDHETTPSYTLTVEAEDDHGKTDTVTVTVTVTDVVEDAPPAPGNLNATLLSGAFTLSWDAVTGATKYEAQHTTDASDAGTVTWTALAETTGTMQDYTPAGGVACNTEYRFRVRAYGDGTAYLAGWGTESAVESVMSGPCDNAPEFDESSYGLTVAEDAATGSSVGTVVATDSDVGDTVSYSIIAGNDDGKFAMDGGTGEITVAAALDAAELAFHLLTVEARDGYGYTDTAQVGIALLLTECSNGTVVPNPSSNPKLVRDCSMLLTARDALVGDGSLNWSDTRRINNWRGVIVGSTQNRGSYVERVQLPNRGLTGSIRPEIGGLRDLLELTLTSNDLTGEIPPELGQLVNLDDLTLSYNELTGEIPGELGELTGLGRLLLNSNQLTGEIPPELGRLDNVDTLWLQRNRLTGEIPPELGGLAGATQIHLHTNRLTGPIPWQLTELTALTTLQIAGNQLEGCVPPALRRLASNDIGLLGLSDCTEEGPAPAPGGLNATLADGTFTVTWSAVTGAEEYEVQHRLSGSGDDWESLAAVTGTTDTYTPAGGPLCGSTYEFRVRSYGDAVTYAAGWGPISTETSVTTSTCSS